MEMLSIFKSQRRKKRINPQKRLGVNVAGTSSSAVKILSSCWAVHCGCNRSHSQSPGAPDAARRRGAAPGRQCYRGKPRGWQTWAQVSPQLLPGWVPEHHPLPCRGGLSTQLLLELRLVLLKFQALYMCYYQRHRCYSLGEKTEVWGMEGLPHSCSESRRWGAALIPSCDNGRHTSLGAFPLPMRF